MRPVSFVLIPVFAATLGLTLATAPVVAQDVHEHGAAPSGSCCGNSGSAAAIHDHSPADPVDGDPAPPAEQAHGTSGCCGHMNAHTTGGCCAGMTMNHSAPADGSAMKGGCCAGMMSHGAAPDPSSFAMPGSPGCSATKTQTAAAAEFDDGSVTE